MKEAYKGKVSCKRKEVAFIKATSWREKILGLISSVLSLKKSREFRVLGKIRLAFFQEGVFTFFGFIREVIQQCGVAGQLLDA